MVCILILLYCNLHHHRLLAAVRKGKHKPSVVVDGDAFDGGAESAVLPFGIKKVKLAEFKEETAEIGRASCRERVCLSV